MPSGKDHSYSPGAISAIRTLFVGSRCLTGSKGKTRSAAQATVAGHEPINEILLLTTHGILHLLGFDHAEPEEEREMFGLQRQILEAFYRGEVS